MATVQEAFEAMWAEIPADDPFWQVVIGDPGVADMWADAVFFRAG